MSNITRRSALRASGGALGAAGLAAAALPAGAANGVAFDLNDPSARARARAKVIGSVGNETTYTFNRLNLYGYMNDGNLIPFVTMNNLNVMTWTPLANGNYAGKGAEAGYYCKFDTDEPLESWKNPVTGETRPVWQFVGGPMSVEITPDAAITGASSRLKPISMRMEVLGPMLFVPTRFGSGLPSPFDPAVWPKESAGPTYYWDTNSVFAAKAADVADPKTTAAPAFAQFQNMVSFHPWFGMGGHAGRTSGHGYGTKLMSLDALPPAVRAGFEKHTPEIFTPVSDWKEPRRDFEDYMRTHKPG